MTAHAWMPEVPYLYREEAPPVGGARPFCQGDVFVGLPLVRAAYAPKRKQWKAKVNASEESLAMLVDHPCSSRSHESHALKSELGVARVRRCPEGFGRPWTGYYQLFPLPGLLGEGDYVADLSAVCPVRCEYLEGHRVACLSVDGLAALLDRLARNATRLEAAQVPGHFRSEAERLSHEFDLWELWSTQLETENGFQDWLDEPWAERDGSSRREALRMDYEEIREELERHLAAQA